MCLVEARRMSHFCKVINYFQRVLTCLHKKDAWKIILLGWLREKQYIHAHDAKSVASTRGVPNACADVGEKVLNHLKEEGLEEIGW